MGWRVLWDAHARALAATVSSCVGLLLVDFVLAYARLQYGRELARMSSALTQAERQRVDAIATSEQNRLAIAVDLVRREALGDAELHLSVDTGRSLLYLARQGAPLREMRVRLGRGAIVGRPPDTVLLTPPLGKRLVARVVDASYRWLVPEWVYRDRGLAAPAERRIPDALGPLAVLLDSGAVLYSRPAEGPLGDAGYVLPGSVRAEAADLDAVRESLQPGMTVYFH